jgi:hypothetical protein
LALVVFQPVVLVVIRIFKVVLHGDLVLQIQALQVRLVLFQELAVVMVDHLMELVVVVEQVVILGQVAMLGWQELVAVAVAVVRVLA